MDSLRLEKAYRHFGHDIGGENHVLEAGLGFVVKTNKPRSAFGDFIGRDAVLRKRETEITKRLLQFRLRDPTPLLYHTEPIVLDGAVASYVTSGGFGYTLGAAVGLGYVPCRIGETAEAIQSKRLEIEVGGMRVPATASLKPMYDPDASRTRT